VNAWAQFDDFDVTLTPAAETYCHVSLFPQGWETEHFDDRAPQRLLFGSSRSEYEFRVEGVLSTKFLVRAFTEFVGTNYYTNNQYRIDLSYATVPVVSAGSKEWNAAAVEFRGFKFAKSGAIWAQSYRGPTLLSPDQA
jgi:hypothetical protein